MTTVKQGSTFEIKRILCPVDLSDFSPPVLAHAAALARLYGAEITALHVFAEGAVTEPPPAPPSTAADAPSFKALLMRSLGK